MSSCRAPIGRLSPLPCLITWLLHVCYLPVVEGLIFCISATPHLGTSFPLFHVCDAVKQTVKTQHWCLKWSHRKDSINSLCPISWDSVSWGPRLHKPNPIHCWPYSNNSESERVAQCPMVVLVKLPGARCAVPAFSTYIVFRKQNNEHQNLSAPL